MTRIALLFGLFGAAAFAAQPAQTRRLAPPAVAVVAPPQTGVAQIYGQAPETPGRGYLGIGVADIDAESAKKLKLPEVRGVEITRVEEDSPAAKAGLKPDDVVLEYNGQRVEGTEQLTRMVRETPPGRQVKLVISRNSSNQTLTVTTGQARGGMGVMGGIRGGIPGGVGAPIDRDMQRQLEEMQRRLREFRMPDVPEPFMSWRSSALGIEGEALTSQLAAYFGVNKGVLVRSVSKDSPAGKAGIKAGDVIVKIDGVEVSTPAQIAARLRLAGKQTLPVTLVRNRQDTTLSVTIDSAGPGGGRRIRSSRELRAPIRFRIARPSWV